MTETVLPDPPAPIVILNGAPRAGKSSIVAAIQTLDPRPWINLGVDAHMGGMMPKRLSPGIGLRPGGERPDLEPLLPRLYAALFLSIAAHSRAGLPVVADVGLHDAYSRPLGILPLMVTILSGLPVLFAGVHCPLGEIMARRRAKSDRTGVYEPLAGDTVPEPVLRWQAAVHRPGLYDLDIDTSRMTAEDGARRILDRLSMPPASPTAFERLAEMNTGA